MKKIQLLMNEQFTKMCSTGKLFRVSLTGDKIWDLYLSSFKEVVVFRDPNSSDHNCNNCKNFVRRYGNIVSISDTGNLMSIFDIDTTQIDEEYRDSITALVEAISKSAISNVFLETYDELNSLNYESNKKSQTVYKLGISQNFKQYTAEEAEKYGKVNTTDVYTFNHLSLLLPKQFVDQSGASVESLMASYRDRKTVFQRGMEEISIDTLYLVRDLINQDSLLNGKSYLQLLTNIISIKEVYNDCPFKSKDNWFWAVTYSMPEAVAKFRNTLLGTLCVELTQGEDLNKACLNWNKRADPVNYMKATAPITKKQIAEAQKFVEDNGYADSFDRRLATIDDIKASEILHMNSGTGKLKTASIFDNVKATSTQHKRAEFDKVEEIGIDKFMESILPTATSLEVYVENRLQSNFCTLTKSVDDNSKNIFKYTNNYSKTFNGNLAGKSQIQEAVESLGGKTDGVLRFSIMWAEDGFDNSDLDAHCVEPGNNRIYFGNKLSNYSGGNLDIDIRYPQGHKQSTSKPVVENITFPTLERMKDGEYKFMVNQYAAKSSRGFKAEISFNGNTYFYHYDKPVSGTITVATVSLSKGVFSIEHSLPVSNEVSKEIDIWGITTNNFHKVNLVCLSPNYWGDNKVGNKHYLFMIDGCKTDSPVRGFHNEDLNQDLLAHRKVLEVLGTTTMIQPTDKQLSGIGFNATVRDELIVKVKGTHQRVLKIKF